MTKLLAVDDDPDILYTLSTIGDLAGWKMATTDSPRAALTLLREEKFQAIIVDYHMPEMDGLALVRAIRRLDQHVPIIVLTVDERMALAERFKEAGADDFAVKPIKAPDFISRLNLHIASPRPVLATAEEFPKAWEEDPDCLPKGLSAPTMSVIVSVLEKEAQKKGPTWLGADQIAALAGVAYQTVWRYLDALESEGLVEVQLSYGKRGRPRKQYRLSSH
jgi:two-component system response regulator DctR